MEPTRPLMPARARRGAADRRLKTEEGEEVLEKAESPEVRDAMLIAGVQKVEHYEIAKYGTLCTWAE
jgi:ferritin-like metal-binding protein YciE